MTTTFKTVYDDLTLAVSASHTSGASTITVSDASTVTSFPVRLTAFRDTSERANYVATSKVGNVLTVTVVGTDAALQAGDTLQCLVNADDVTDLQVAVNSAETAIGLRALDSAVVHLAGTETVTGAKTFATPPVLGSLTGILTATSGTVTSAVAGTDYLVPSGSGAALTGVVHTTGNETVTGTKTFVTAPILGSLTGLLAASSGTVTSATEGTDYLSGATSKLPLPFSFAGFGTPTVANDLCPWHHVPYAVVAQRLTLTAKTAPSGNFVVTIKRSADNGSTFPDTVGTVTITSGNKIATTTSFTNANLAAADVLRLDITSVNAAADWTARLTTLSKNQ